MTMIITVRTVLIEMYHLSALFTFDIQNQEHQMCTMPYVAARCLNTKQVGETR